MESKNKVLTIVVPSYNTQAYIDQCIPTMLAHSYTEQMELLLVNDGSRDNTLEKLKWYEKHYPATVKVLDQENGGHGSVINIGINEAKGVYFKVIDGDDWVLPENLEKMIRQLKHCEADLVIHPYIKYNMHTKKSKVIRFDMPKYQEMLLDDVASGLGEVEIHAATYRTELLRDNGIQVRERCFYEDTEYNIFPIRDVNTVYACNYPVYVYRIGTVSQSIHPRQAFRYRDMHRVVIDDCIAYYDHNVKRLSQAKKDYIRRVITKRIRSQYMIYLKNPMTKERMQELLKWDRELKIKAGGFYKESERFPVWLLRKNMRFAYPFVKILYWIYAGFRWVYG